MRTKLLLVLTIPLLGFLGVAGVQVASSTREALDLDRLARQVALGRQINVLVHELQRERDRTVGTLAAFASQPGSVRDLGGLSPDRTAVDRAITALDQGVQGLQPDKTFSAAYQRVRTALADLARIREGVESGWLRTRAAFEAYTRIIDELHALLVPTGVSGDVGQAMSALVEVARAKELTAEVRGLIFIACSAGGFGPTELETLTAVRAQQQVAVTRFRADATPAAVAVWDEVVSGQAVRNANRLEQTVVANATTGDDLGVDPQQWWQASTTRLELMRGAEGRLLESAIAAASARSAEQWRSTQITIAFTLALLLVAVLTSLGIGRTMVQSLSALRDQALEVAQRKLPEMIERLRTAPRDARVLSADPIAVRSGDEVGEVAEAFTAVHRSAVRLAAEQALMRHTTNAIHVNLARRSQTLVERQLQLLDKLEASETDPDQLANLFLLDHLATRMRRNDENLLVLAGGEATRRWTEPVPLSAVVLAAAAEIEHYQRVRHDITDNVHIVGHAVADLVRIIAELVENATNFSPPQTNVTVLGWAADGAAALVIEDQGFGMSPEALAQANRQVASPTVGIDVAAAERMGLVVVGHLAHRHGIRVELRSQGRGVTVLVQLPPSLLAEPPAQPTFVGGRPYSRPSLEPLPAGSARTTTPAAELRRSVPIRAEDILGQAQQDTSVWWSRGPKPASTASTASAAAPVKRPAAPTTTTSAGLPRRVPMAQLPLSSDQGAKVPVETNPEDVGATLSRFYSGVHRAVAEDQDDDFEKVK